MLIFNTEAFISKMILPENWYNPNWCLAPKSALELKWESDHFTNKSTDPETENTHTLYLGESKTVEE